jgi:hypothetical protein
VQHFLVTERRFACRRVLPKHISLSPSLIKFLDKLYDSCLQRQTMIYAACCCNTSLCCVLYSTPLYSRLWTALYVHNLQFYNPNPFFCESIQLRHATINPPTHRRFDHISLAFFQGPIAETLSPMTCADCAYGFSASSLCIDGQC